MKSSMSLMVVAVVLDARYTRGLRNLNKGSDSSESLKSRAWAFTVGLGWPV